MLPLTFVPKGEIHHILRIAGKDAIRSRLRSLGLCEGQPVRVCQKLGKDLVIQTGNTRIALGEDLAKRIMVGKGERYDTE